MKNNTHTALIGIWGYGITGKAAVRYFKNQSVSIAIYDKTPLGAQDTLFLQQNNVAVFSPEELDTFLEQCTAILPSPGIDLRPYAQYQSKWINELDLFYRAWRKPIIAITGSVGKTTVTHVLSTVLSHADLRMATGGNIGTPMLDLLALRDSSDYALLELSSFQLEQIKEFTPDFALWTNFYPNHLDRHSNEDEYRAAKARMSALQNNAQRILLPVHLHASAQGNGIKHYFGAEKPSSDFLSALDHQSSVYYFESTTIVRLQNGVSTPLIKRSDLPAISYEENWLILCATLDLLSIPLNIILSATLSLPEHRLEHVATINEVAYYNDSKSTTPQSTLAAVHRLNKKPILLLLGGVGKGIDRAPLIQQLAGTVKKIYCFGKEAQELERLCLHNTIPSAAFYTLDDAFKQAVIESAHHDQLLLSPAGASFDLFTNYIERGAHFKKLVNDLTPKE